MSEFITALTGKNGLTAATITGLLTDLVPFLAFIVPLVLGLLLFGKLLYDLLPARR